jgi:hypothetical protein
MWEVKWGTFCYGYIIEGINKEWVERNWENEVNSVGIDS